MHHPVMSVINAIVSKTRSSRIFGTLHTRILHNVLLYAIIPDMYYCIWRSAVERGFRLSVIRGSFLAFLTGSFIVLRTINQMFLSLEVVPRACSAQGTLFLYSSIV